MVKIKPPVIHKTNYDLAQVRQLNQEIIAKVSIKDQPYLLEYPTVYVINHQLATPHRTGYTVYVG